MTQAKIQAWATKRSLTNARKRGAQPPVRHAHIPPNRFGIQARSRPQAVCLVYLGGPITDVYIAFDPRDVRACERCALIVQERHHELLETR